MLAGDCRDDTIGLLIENRKLKIQYIFHQIQNKISRKLNQSEGMTYVNNSTSNIIIQCIIIRHYFLKRVIHLSIFIVCIILEVEAQKYLKFYTQSMRLQ